MAITINGTGSITGLTAGGLPDGSVTAADIASGVIPAALSNAEDGAGTDFEFNSGYGSVATAYGVRAWINFDGQAATIGTGRASGNMDAVTDNGVGDYTLNFTNDMPDANYALLTAGERGATNYNVAVWSQAVRAVGSVDIWSVIMNASSAPAPWDIPGVFVAIVR